MSRYLPPDLVRSIAEHLHDNTHTLVSLCLIDKEAHSSVVPLLYKTIHLSNIQSIGQFCDAIVQSKRNLGIYPTSIHFTPEDPSDKHIYPIVDSIKNALYQTPNLTDLILKINTPNLADLHQHLQSHPPLFSLHRLACHFTGDLEQFLSTQPSIHTLTIYVTAASKYSAPLSIFTSPPASVLPRLKSITADGFTVVSLLPGRPISHIDILALFHKITAPTLYKRLGESSAPQGIESVFVSMLRGTLQEVASDLITPLKEVCGTSLGYLKVRILVNSTLFIQNQDGWVAGLLAVSLSGFIRLRHFHVESPWGDCHPRYSHEAMGSVGMLAFWTKWCPSLRRVTFLGVDIS
ncbi:hypothetical protein BDV93DRAFT_519958 [Ceratobasidium sp. AG-I]|nr:hypothetical protein BDV93DRAFT_519958 [Ceratobasidium sp. AG-I]